MKLICIYYSRLCNRHCCCQTFLQCGQDLCGINTPTCLIFRCLAIYLVMAWVSPLSLTSSQLVQLSPKSRKLYSLKSYPQRADVETVPLFGAYRLDTPSAKLAVFLLFIP
jgi:hypothetical protein